MNHNVVTIDFRGDTLYGLEDETGIWIAVTPICEARGVAANKQRRRIQADPVLREGSDLKVSPAPTGSHEALYLRLDLVNGWLFGIHASRVSEAARPKVLAYQRECCRVLFAHFARKGASAPRDAAEFDTMGYQYDADLARDLRRENMTPPIRLDSPIGLLAVHRSLVSEARQVFGVKAARELWGVVGLPRTPAMAAEPDAAEPEMLSSRDLVWRFLAECTAPLIGGPGVRSADLYAVYVAWAAAVSVPACPMKLFAHVLKALGYATKKSSVIYWLDLHLTRRPDDFGSEA